MTDVTKDAFLDGRLEIYQPKTGYRAATDPVLLAAAVPAQAGQRVLDVGCGVGVAGLCLKTRVNGVGVSGVELQDWYAQLARQNAEHNRKDLTIYHSDLSALPRELRDQNFDHVMTNPPFFKPSDTTANTDKGKDTANVETLELPVWIEHCLKRLAPKGHFTIIHRANRLSEILTAMSDRCGNVKILPLSARTGKDAQRVIVQGQKGSKAALKLLFPFVLHKGSSHKSDGDSFTKTASEILRNAGKLTLD